MTLLRGEGKPSTLLIPNEPLAGQTGRRFDDDCVKS
jgi:hypothetical protein